MSTGKRLAKRSIIGTRVCAPGGDGKYYSGVIHAVKTPGSFPENNNCINLTPNTHYSVRFDASSFGRQGGGYGVACRTMEFKDVDLIGPGFCSVLDVCLVAGQKVFVTYKGREVCGDVIQHNCETDDVLIAISAAPGFDCIVTTLWLFQKNNRHHATIFGANSHPSHSIRKTRTTINI
ncbi:hypothetical protein AMK59_2448 [Oryctes borbonicus]|uniref:DUF4772 domain-containing protein n=1 Tax=Oryctes borbonicus TaxID=1629725 RepID=A0A0T6BDK9_9SCAR|nr:hypothetical protein AMK59_2448 [Oryctes borbonicus]